MVKKYKLCYVDTNSFIAYIKTNNIYKDITKNVEARSDTSSFELDRLFPKGKNKKVIELMKDDLDGKIIIKFVALIAKAYNNK